MLREVAEAEAQKEKGQGRKIVFLIDGLDEIDALDPTFSDLPFAAELPGVVWICAGQPEPALEEKFSRDGSDRLFGEEGLPRLGDEDVRGVLIEQCGRSSYELFERDEPVEGGEEKYRNAFIETLVEKSEGLPVYLTLLCEDIREGRFTFRDEDRLPKKLSEYYERLLDRLGVGDDAAQVLTLVFYLLAHARGPMPADVIREALSSHPLLQEVADDDFSTALSRGHVTLRLRATAEGTLGYVLYHDSFRKHLLMSPGRKGSVRLALRYLLDFCRRWALYGTKMHKLLIKLI